jgi:hypothetical protein
MPLPAVPTVPPDSRGTGFWAAVTCAVAVGVLVALLLGFLIGQGTRTSDGGVQRKLDAQARSAQIAQQQALAQQKQDLSRGFSSRLQSVIDRVSAKAEARGVREGRDEGFAQGQSSGFSAGQSAGYSRGFDDGTCYAPLTLTYIC